MYVCIWHQNIHIHTHNQYSSSTVLTQRTQHSNICSLCGTKKEDEVWAKKKSFQTFSQKCFIEASYTAAVCQTESVSLVIVIRHTRILIKKLFSLVAETFVSTVTYRISDLQYIDSSCQQRGSERELEKE